MKRLLLLLAAARGTPRRRVAVCFWGINRSLDLTLQKTSGRTDQGKFTTYFTRGLAGDSRLTLDYCAELVTNAFRLTPSARRKDSADSLLNSSKACLTHYNGPSKHFWRTRLT